MRAKRSRVLWLAGLGGLAGLLAGCGSGSLVVNVDVYSFLKGTGQDTVVYAIPPNTSNTVASSTPQKVSTPGAGSSLVDSVLIFGTLNLQNQSGTGTLGLQLFIAADSAGTYNPSAAGLTVAPKTVSGAVSVLDTVSGSLLKNVRERPRYRLGLALEECRLAVCEVAALVPRGGAGLEREPRHTGRGEDGPQVPHLVGVDAAKAALAAYGRGRPAPRPCRIFHW